MSKKAFDKIKAGLDQALEHARSGRDMDKQPYSFDERRVAQFFFDLGTGGGDDPIGSILLSHTVLAQERNQLRDWKHKQEIDWPMEIERRNRELAAMTQERDELQRTFDLRWTADMRAIKRWQAAHPGRENIWPDHADLVVWLLGELEKPAI